MHDFITNAIIDLWWTITLAWEIKKVYIKDWWFTHVTGGVR